MKQIMRVLSILLLVSLPMLGDGWNSSTTSQSTSATFTTMDNYANKDGIHVVRIEEGSPNTLKYNLLNSSGTLIRTTTIDNGISNNPVIVADNSFKLYAVFIKGTQIVVRQSSDVGQSWTNPTTNTKDFESGHTTGYGIDAVVDGVGKLHIVYSTDNEVYYRNYAPNTGTWANFKNVTDHTDLPTGTQPSITVSSGRVHISCTYSVYVKSRDRVIESDSWETPQQINPSGSGQDGFCSSIINDGTNIYLLYIRATTGLTSYTNYSKRSISGTTWDTPVQIDASNYQYPSRLIKTLDGNLFAIYSNNGDIKYRKYNSSSWESPVTLSSDMLSETQVSAVNTGNDIFINWLAYSTPNSLLMYRQYDAAPTVPTSVSISTPYINISWAANQQPDIQHYEVWRKVNSGSYSSLGTTTGTSFDDPDYATGGSIVLAYKVRAKDLANQVSDYSSVVSINNGAQYKNGYGWNGLSTLKSPETYSMDQNYPNPFNPVTTISYALPEASEVSIKVFDRLGKEVATILRAHQNAGSYSLPFDASAFSSGLYFYTITAGNFTSTKKMILLK